MTTKERVELTKKFYIENLKRQQKWYGLDDVELGTAIKFVESYAHYILWTLKFDKIEELEESEVK